LWNQLTERALEANVVETAESNMASVTAAGDQTLHNDKSRSLGLDDGHLDPEAEKKLVWKCDRNVLPAITFLYLIAFLDRSNIGMRWLLRAALREIG